VNLIVIGISLAVSLAALLRLARQGGSRNILFCVAAFFTLFAYGPVINLITGADVYVGISRSHVDTVTVGFTLALISLVIGDAMAPQRSTFDLTAVTGGDRRYLLLPAAFVGLIGYAGFICLTRFPELLSASKRTQVAVAGSGHHIYLLIELAAVSMYFLTRQNIALRRLWAINLTVYVIYCMLTSERDFLFVIFSVLVHREIMTNSKRILRLAGAGVAAILSGTILFASRAHERFDITAIFNQGSILFVDTFLARFVPSTFPHRWGATYLDTLISILPSWLVDTGHKSLSEWLVSLYAPGSKSGYGFSLTGEAYLNFGLVGIPIAFLAMTLAHRYVVNRADTSDWWAYFSVYFTAVWMYALRGDSSQLVKSLLYGALFFGFLRAISVKHRPTRSGGTKLLRTATSSKALPTDRPVTRTVP
jgi:hypothetical protein